MTAKFWINNKDHFLQYFGEKGNLSASANYDEMINNGKFEEMERVVKENTEFNCTEYLVQLEAEGIKNMTEQKVDVMGLSLSPKAAEFLRSIINKKNV